VVILGEHHWVRHDVALVRDLVPRLRAAGVIALAVEVFPASEQEAIDRLVTAEAWDAPGATAVLRAGEWPYREYGEILQAAWAANRARPAGSPTLRVLGLGPGADWRERLLPRGEDYDGFMAKRVLDQLWAGDGRVLVYCGVHHAFTRYYQPELPRERRVEAFMDRMGNRLWRARGEEVFLVTLHRPVRCRKGDGFEACLPLDGAVDCAASRLDHPVGFDVVGSPLAELRFPVDTYYALGYPSLRFGDITDGYIWTQPIETYQGMSVVPLAEYAPDAKALGEVRARNPLSDDRNVGDDELARLWRQEEQEQRAFPASRGWTFLFGWREQCGR
jgi:hypothetical protein